MTGLRLVKVAVRSATGLILHLNGGMANVVVMFQEVLDASEQRIVVVRRDHLDMERHDRFPPHQPDVHVVDITDFRNSTAQVALQLVDVHGCRSPFKQFIHALLQQPPGAAQDQTRHQHGQNRIDRRPAGIEDHQRGDNRPD